MEEQQRVQFIEFSRAWDQYMTEYEQAAATSVVRMKQRHGEEMGLLRQEVESGVVVKYTLSKDLMAIRAQERLMFQVREYDKAEELRALGDAMEKEEKARLHEKAIAAKA